MKKTELAAESWLRRLGAEDAAEGLAGADLGILKGIVTGEEIYLCNQPVCHINGKGVNLGRFNVSIGEMLKDLKERRV